MLLLILAGLALVQATPAPDDPVLTSALRRAAAEAPGTAGISVVHLESGRSGSVNPGMRFPMMSVYKLPIVIHALRLSERGRLDLSERVTLMPEDRRPNEAEFAADYHGLCCIADMRPFSLEKFTAMTDCVPAEVRALAAKAYESDPRDTATPAGYATLLVRLYRRELLNEASTKWLLDLMQQMHARDGRIRAGLSAGTPAALRPGTSGLTAGVRAAHNDTGIITLPGGRGHLAIAVFLKGADGTEEARDAAIARVARAAYEWATSTGAPSHRQRACSAPRAGWHSSGFRHINLSGAGGEVALGANPSDVLRLVLREGMTPVAAGILIGLGGAAVLARVMKRLLFGVDTFDPLTFAAVAVTLTAVALAACYLPARRAMTVDPATSLR